MHNAKIRPRFRPVREKANVKSEDASPIHTTFLISTLAQPHIGKFTILANLAFICFMLMTFCWITLWKSILVVAIYSCFYVAMFFAGQSIRNRISKSMDTPLIEKRNEDLEDIKQEMLRQQEMFAGAPTVGPGDVPAPAATNRAVIESIPTITGEENAGQVVVVGAAAPAVVPSSPEPPPAPQVQVVPIEATPIVFSNAPPTPVALVSNVPTTPIEDAVWGEARKKLKIGGTVKGKNGKWTAFVNNSLVEVGDLVSARYEGATYRWRVRTISREGLTFDPVDSRPQK